MIHIKDIADPWYAAHVHFTALTTKRRGLEEGLIASAWSQLNQHLGALTELITGQPSTLDVLNQLYLASNSAHSLVGLSHTGENKGVTTHHATTSARNLEEAIKKVISDI